MKTNYTLNLFAALGVFISAPVLAQDGSVKVSVDNTPVPFTGQQPINDKGHVMVPLRGVFEKMGAKVSYDAATHKVTAKSDKSSIELNVGTTDATVDGKPVTLDSPTKITNGSVLVPLRFVSEILGSAVKFDKASQTVMVDTSKAPAPSQGTTDPSGTTGTQTAQMPTEPNTITAPATPAQATTPAPPVIINNNVPPSAPPETTPQTPVQAVTPPGPPPAATPPVVAQTQPTAPVVVDTAPAAAGFALASYLPYIIGALVLLGLLAWFLNRRGKTGQVIAADDKER